MSDKSATEKPMSKRIKTYMWIFVIAYFIITIALIFFFKIIGMAIAFIMVKPAIEVMKKMKIKFED